jgi:hypothetical protein
MFRANCAKQAATAIQIACVGALTCLRPHHLHLHAMQTCSRRLCMQYAPRVTIAVNALFGGGVHTVFVHVCVCVLLGSECDELLVVIWPWDLYSVL